MYEKQSIMSKIGYIFLTHRRFLQRELIPYKITLKQSFVLKQLDGKEYLNPSQIAGMLFCDRPTATVILKNLEREGWVKREKDTENGKQFRIAITPEGREKLDSIRGLIGDGLFDPTGCLTAQENEQLDSLLNKVGRGLKTIE